MMLYDPLTWFFGIGCVAGIVLAAHSPERREATAVASLIAINWALFILAYTEWSPKLALDHIGVHTTSVHLWMLADMVCGCAAIMVSFHAGWARAIWLVAMAQLFFHTAMDAGAVDPVFYTDVLLNFALLCQLAVFFVIGGPDAWDRLHRRFDRLRIFGRAASAANPRAE